MAFEIPGFKLGHRTADSDLSAKQYYALAQSATGVDVAGLDAASVTVLQNKPTSGNICEEMVSGVTKMIAGGAIAVGDPIGTLAGGKAKKQVTVGKPIIGRAQTAAGADGEVMSVLLKYEGNL